jgi:hypothetical protein
VAAEPFHYLAAGCRPHVRDELVSRSADLTGISIGTGKRWSQSAKRDWAAYVGQRDRRGPRGDQQAETR